MKKNKRKEDAMEPIQITYRNCQESDALRNSIREHAERLVRFCSDIIHCRVAVEKPHRKHQHGNLYRVRVELKVPRRVLVASRNPAQHLEHADPYVAIRDAFLAATRKLEDYVRERRGDVKKHESPLRRQPVEDIAVGY
jgi:ribosome-associated translation inhibitor RaiA